LYRPDVTGNVRPEAVLTKGIDAPGGIAVDSSGDLWVASEAGHVIEYSRADLAQASPVLTMSISYSGGGLAFDPSGDLWVINGTDVAEFTKAEIAKSGSPQPVASLPDNCSAVFVSSGDLWEGSSADWLAEFTTAQLARLARSASKSPFPQVMISSESLNMPCKPLFDRNGDLWAGNYGSDTVVEFTREQLAGPSAAGRRLPLAHRYLSSRAMRPWTGPAIFGSPRWSMACSGSPRTN
jgi:streptogramin lyase